MTPLLQVADVVAAAVLVAAYLAALQRLGS